MPSGDAATDAVRRYARDMHRLMMVVALGAGCSPTSYTFSATTKGEVPRQPGPNGCEFTVLTSPPDEAFEELGTFKHYNGAVPKEQVAFRKALAPLVCEVGAHAVIVTLESQYKTATAIKYGKGLHL
jgi:hypothetical protein